MNYSPLVGIHFTEDKRRTRGANALCREVCHRAQFRFASRAKPFNVTDQALALGKLSSESLGNEVLHCLQEFAAFGLQQLRVRPTQIQQTLGRRFVDRNLMFSPVP